MASYGQTFTRESSINDLLQLPVPEYIYAKYVFYPKHYWLAGAESVLNTLAKTTMTNTIQELFKALGVVEMYPTKTDSYSSDAVKTFLESDNSVDTIERMSVAYKHGAMLETPEGQRQRLSFSIDVYASNSLGNHRKYSISVDGGSADVPPRAEINVYEAPGRFIYINYPASANLDIKRLITIPINYRPEGVTDPTEYNLGAHYFYWNENEHPVYEHVYFDTKQDVVGESGAIVLPEDRFPVLVALGKRLTVSEYAKRWNREESSLM